MSPFLSSSRPFVLTLVAALCLSACGGGGDSGASTPTTGTAPTAPVVVAAGAPKDLGFTDAAPVPDVATVPPFVDNVATNQRGDARYATKETNAGVRVVAGFLDFWTPSTLLVDAGQTAPAQAGFPAVVASNWSGIPGDATDGKSVNAAVLGHNIQYVIDVTTARTSAQELAAYLDDRRGKAYSVSDGLGPLTAAWRAAAQQTTTITGIAADATTVKYDDGGNNSGVGGSANPGFGTVVDLVNNIGENGSTEPAKRYFKYARPWRWSSSVKVVPSLEPAKSSTPTTDGGFVSGHTAEAVRNGFAFGYVVPERFQEMVARGLELGENRILAGMHSPLDVIGGRIQGHAVAAASLSTGANAARKAAARAQAQSVLMTAVGATDATALNTFAHSQGTDQDRFADHAASKAAYLRRMTFGFTQVGDKTKPAVVPKGAEVLLETRLPYLDAEQRRVVLKTTAIASGYPAMDDPEGWGRLNLFDAADGYGAFNGDVVVKMDASLGGFHAMDSWRNDIGGAGKLSKTGTGTLRLGGKNSYSGGTQLVAGTLQADSASAFGVGNVYVGGGTLVCNAPSTVTMAGAYTQLGGSTLQMNIGGNGAGRLSVKGVAALDGTLNITFKAGAAPSVGDVLTVVSSGALIGKFSAITVPAGYKVTPTYTATELSLRIDAAV
ncbi:phosphatase PAP2 family protein [Variovorax arabinosiphilus]|uniref:phosphatase PAP2 family protein n=1 Tax=Variovorax arabinosiphilus TaxID=3053498 RepID=UPI0025790FE2|nr:MULTISPECIES: phosphatase PAP2 family protein [unclassified Variovorax]MDM0118796.1 phosphatase PAP2 family protein [Variovorax sp. J2L1-78]MDM0129221.1 phosphatase PAP2 family protein [Variovorax sp. J2L1-63]MDM0232992.1 phosphatase PAP2 family protein [Variovorax sp. J2R1-6]